MRIKVKIKETYCFDSGFCILKCKIQGIGFLKKHKFLIKSDFGFGEEKALVRTNAYAKLVPYVNDYLDRIKRNK